MSAEHPDTDALRTYLQDCEAPGQAAVRGHLLACAECRDQVDVLAVLSSAGAQTGSVTEPGAGLDEAAHETVIDYVEGRLQGAARERAKNLIDNNPEAMRAALHYAGHRQAMPKEEQVTQTSGAAMAEKTTGRANHPGWRERIRAMLDVRAALWVSVPVTAFAAAAVTFVLLQNPVFPFGGERIAVASYRDNPVIRFRSNDTLPGIGFFSRAGESSEAFDDVRVLVEDQDPATLSLSIAWPEVDQANMYTLRLQAFDAGQKTVLGTVTTTRNIAAFDIDIAGASKRYEWILTGETGNNRSFQASGGFVVDIARDRSADSR